MGRWVFYSPQDLKGSVRRDFNSWKRKRQKKQSFQHKKAASSPGTKLCHQSNRFLKIQTSSENLKFCLWEFKDSTKQGIYDDFKRMSKVHVGEKLANLTEFLKSLRFLEYNGNLTSRNFESPNDRF